MIIFILLLILALFLQVTITTLPLVFLVLLSFAAVTKNLSVFWIALILGIIIDIFRLESIGSTSIFFLISIFLMFLYEKKFEVKTYSFIIVFSFFAVLIESLIFSLQYPIYQAILSFVLEALLFTVLSFVLQKKEIKWQGL